MRRASGMTLVELLAAMAIFLGLAGMVLQVLGGGLDLWSAGERTREESEQASALLDRLAGELRHARATDGGPGEPRVRLLCDRIALDTDGDSTRDFQAQRLIFVRALLEERVHPALHRAGTAAEARQPFLGAIEAQDARFQATEGLVEQALVPQPDPRPGYEGRLVLWRALRSPPGGPESLFRQAQDDEGGLEHAPLEPLAENVLLFQLEFFDDSVSDFAGGADAGGPHVLWDSTRAVVPAGDGWTGFRHARGKASLALAEDDCFPDAVRVTLVVAPPPGEGPQAQLASDVPASSGTVRAEVVNGRYLRRLGESARHVKLGHEWVEVRDHDGVSMLIVGRGLFGTAPALHEAGTPVLTGRRFARTIALPCGRGDWIDRDGRGRR